MAVSIRQQTANRKQRAATGASIVVLSLGRWVHSRLPQSEFAPALSRVHGEDEEEEDEESTDDEAPGQPGPSQPGPIQPGPGQLNQQAPNLPAPFAVPLPVPMTDLPSVQFQPLPKPAPKRTKRPKSPSPSAGLVLVLIRVSPVRCVQGIPPTAAKGVLSVGCATIQSHV